MPGPYNPLDRRRLAESVADALLLETEGPLSNTDQLRGAGIYAIYYSGDFELYRALVAEAADGNRRPIYVGKAVPKGARKGGLTFDASTGTALRDRLRQHAASIREAGNIEIRDFQFRSLVVDDIWIPLGESMLIEKFKPVWNVVVDGFGNKDPGARRATQYRSPWDAIHPGRKFAEKLAAGDLDTEALTRKAIDHLAGLPVQTIEVSEATDIGATEEEAAES